MCAQFDYLLLPSQWEMRLDLILLLENWGLHVFDLSDGFVPLCRSVAWDLNVSLT